MSQSVIAPGEQSRCLLVSTLLRYADSYEVSFDFSAS
jgi:hypothetical protein